jgi:hypothetical protein
VLTHEASHDCLARLTNDASELEQFRFIDEGLALIMEKKAAGDLEGLRRDAKIAAAVQLRAGNLSLAKLQRWKSYFGDPRGPERPHAYAYPVGASFDLYVWDILGEPAFRRLLVEIGRDRDLDAALHSALRKNLAEVEAAWLATLSRVEPIPPQIVEMLPADGAGEVDPSLKELRVRFNMDMASEVCVVAPCKEGICSSNARWDGPRTLVIAIDRQLEARHSFGFALGDKRERCHFWSTTGLPLPVTSWSFQTR